MKISAKNYPLMNFSSDLQKLDYKLNFANNSYISGKTKILYPKKSKINFWSYQDNLAKKNCSKLEELIFFGLNYNAKRINYFRKPYVLDLQKSHKIKVEENRVSEIKTKIFKRRILFWSYDRRKLTELVSKLKKQRKKNSYSGHGLISRADKYKTKAGKIRQK